MGRLVRLGKLICCTLLLGVCSTALVTGLAQAADDLTELSLEELMNLTVTSASRREQSKVDAAVAISVLTNEDIRRSGATSIPEALRLVPGVNVARLDASRWAITVRGYNTQFANKLLVLIDGRQVYTPNFGGVYWDIQDLPLSDIDRIEVIRGSGGTLWGANAVNGVINVITKNAKDTQGVHAMGIIGNREYQGEGRFGGQIGEGTSYRVWGRGQRTKDYYQPPPPPPPPAQAPRQAHDAWWTYQLGTRIDQQLGDDDHLMIDGRFYQGEDETTNAAGFPRPDTSMIGGHVLARWDHSHSETASTQVQAYYDRTDRVSEVGEKRDTVDLQLQNDFQLELGVPWLVNWGLEFFWTGDQTQPSPEATLVPSDENFYRTSGFAQIQWNFLDGDLQLIGGTKLEWNSYTDFEYQPSGRILWKFIEGNTFWASGSRAVRNPTRLDRDVIATLGPLVLPLGNKDILAESMVSAEAGYRNYMLDYLTLDVTAFYNDYDGLITLDTTTFGFQNNVESESWGTEIELAWQPLPALRFVTSYAYLEIMDTPGPTAFLISGTNDEKSPRHTWIMRALWSPREHLDHWFVPSGLDGAVWYVSAVPGVSDVYGTPVGSYWRLDLRAAWKATDWLTLEAVGQNLTNRYHVEYGSEPGAPPSTYVPRTYYGRITLTF